MVFFNHHQIPGFAKTSWCFNGRGDPREPTSWISSLHVALLRPNKKTQKWWIPPLNMSMKLFHSLCWYFEFWSFWCEWSHPQLPMSRRFTVRCSIPDVKIPKANHGLHTTRLTKLWNFHHHGGDITFKKISQTHFCYGLITSISVFSANWATEKNNRLLPTRWDQWLIPYWKRILKCCALVLLKEKAFSNNGKVAFCLGERQKFSSQA